MKTPRNVRAARMLPLSRYLQTMNRDSSVRERAAYGRTARSAKVPAWDSRELLALAQSKYTWASKRALSRVPEARRWGSAPTKSLSSIKLLSWWATSYSPIYLYARDRQCSVAGQDPRQDIHLVSRTTCKSSEGVSNREKSRFGKTDATDLSMILFRHAPEGPTNTMSCVIRPGPKSDGMGLLHLTVTVTNVHTPAHNANRFVCTLI